jgi:hypothetical protein
MAAAHINPFISPLTTPDAFTWAERVWRTQPQLVRHYLDTIASELHDALLERSYSVRVVLPPVVMVDGELIQLPLNAPQPLLGGLWANLRHHPLHDDILTLLEELQAHPHPAVAEVGAMLAYRTAYWLAYREVPPSPQIITMREPFGEDGRLWGKLETAVARVDELARWQTCLTLAAQVFPMLSEDVDYQRSRAAVEDKYATQHAWLTAARA